VAELRNVDLHAHYPMHLVPGGDTVTAFKHFLSQREPKLNLWDRVRARLVSFASLFANYPSLTSGPSVTVPLMREGEVAVALSVLYSPFDEMDLSKLHGYGLPPEPRYFDSIVRQLEVVEQELEADHAADAVVARTPAEMDAALESGRVAMVHCIEGGFALGATPQDIDANVTELARRGVAYVTLAHLFWRGIATNAPALPFLPDWGYRLLFRQPSDVGLSDLGEAAVRAMAREGVFIDITHMSAHSLTDTFALMDELDPERTVPLIASHMACRFGSLAYNMSDEEISQAAQRGSVLGVIFCDHYTTDGILRGRTKDFDQTVEVMCKHIDRIHSVTGSYDNIGLGSDLDGYIKPTVRGLEDMSKIPDLRLALESHYGTDVAGQICAGNALRVLRTNWLNRK
jgi:microsomal dipeptidase-like Zn-dependent dipeptidase